MNRYTSERQCQFTMESWIKHQHTLLVTSWFFEKRSQMDSNYGNQIFVKSTFCRIRETVTQKNICALLPRCWLPVMSSTMVSLQALSRDLVTCQLTDCAVAFYSTPAKESSNTMWIQALILVLIQTSNAWMQYLRQHEAIQQLSTKGFLLDISIQMLKI